jgi:TPR repeat protein
MSSTRAPLNEARVGLIASREERPPAFAHAVRLYKGDMFFRSLIDLTVVGILVVAAVTEWREVGKMAGGALGALRVPLNTPAQKDAQNSMQRLTDRNGPGAEVIAAIGPPMIERDALKLAGAALADHLDKVATALERGGVTEAAQLVSVLDDRDPTVAYVKAVVTLHQEGPGRVTEARRLLRRATEQAVYPAFVLTGEVLFRLAQIDERGHLPGSERVAIDDTGQTHPATRAELAAEAVLWWERAAAFSRPQGLRLLGMARARGLSGKVDYVGAAALWKDAAERGDAISQLELGKMLMLGHGLQPNSAEAIRMFRLAADRLPVAAIGLATALISKSIAGDAAAAREAIELLEAILDKTKKSDELAFAYHMLGQYYFQAAPTELRNIPRALKAWERSVKNGMRESGWYAGEAYRAGTGVARDLPCAYGFYLKAKSLDAKKVDPILAELERQIGPEGIERGKRISFALTPYPSLGARFAPVNTSLRPDEPKPAPRKESASLAEPPVCTQITDGSAPKSFEEVMSILNSGRK